MRKRGGGGKIASSPRLNASLASLLHIRWTWGQEREDVGKKGGGIRGIAMAYCSSFHHARGQGKRRKGRGEKRERRRHRVVPLPSPLFLSLRAFEQPTQ